MPKSKLTLLNFADLEIRFFAIYGDKLKYGQRDIGKYGFINLYGRSANESRAT